MAFPNRLICSSKGLSSLFRGEHTWENSTGPAIRTSTKGRSEALLSAVGLAWTVEKNYGSTEPPQQKCGSRNFATLTKEGLYEFMKGTVLGTFGNILLKL